MWVNVSQRYPAYVGIYKVRTGNNEFPTELEINFNGFSFDWMDAAITEWFCI